MSYRPVLLCQQIHQNLFLHLSWLIFIKENLKFILFYLFSFEECDPSVNQIILWLTLKLPKVPSQPSPPNQPPCSEKNTDFSTQPALPILARKNESISTSKRLFQWIAMILVVILTHNLPNFHLSQHTLTLSSIKNMNT